MSPARTLLIVLGVWLAAMGVGLWLDAPVARWAHRAAIDRDHPGNHLMKMAGDWRFTLAVALALIVWHRDAWRPAALLALSAALGGVLYTLVKWGAGRRRPLVVIDPLRFSPFVSGWRGFMDEPNLSFPSGHTTLAFATAATLGICVPRWRYLFYGLACITAAERVAENAHYVTDAVAGAGLGTLSAYLVYWAAARLDSRSGARDAVRPTESPRAKEVPSVAN
jgi:undecaprenyl-diphosphatase